MNSPQERVSIETDILPSDIRDCDSGFACRSLSSLCRPPLIQDCGIGEWADGLAIAERVADSQWALHVDPQWIWADNRPVTAADLAQHLAATTTRDPILHFLRTQVFRSIEIESMHSLVLKLRRPVPRLPLLLTSESVKPRQRSGAAAVYGAFQPDSRIYQAGERVTRLTKRGSFSPRLPSQIEILETRSHEEGLTRYADGEIDVTCCTTATPQSLSMMVEQENYRSSRLRLYARLIHEPRHFPPGFGELISKAIDRAWITGLLPGILRPIRGVGDLWLSSAPDAVAGSDHATKPIQLAHLLAAGTKIYYADFSPNGQVVGLLCRYLHESFGIDLRPAAVSLSELACRCLSPGVDLCYSLASPIYDDPSALPAVRAIHGAAASDPRALSAALVEFQVCCAHDSINESAAGIGGATASEICLFEVCANYLSRATGISYSPLGRLTVN